MTVIAASRGAMNSLMAKVVEGHIRRRANRGGGGSAGRAENLSEIRERAE
jgi:DNA-binding FrmR family transcriptional regulator